VLWLFDGGCPQGETLLTLFSETVIAHWTPLYTARFVERFDLSAATTGPVDFHLAAFHDVAELSCVQESG
jgi:hypothetical protein